MNHVPAVRSVPRSSVAVPRAVDVPDVLRSVRNGAAFAVCYAAAGRFADAAISTVELPAAVFVPGALVLTALLLTPLARWWTILVAALVGHWLATIGQGASIGVVLGSFTIDTTATVLAAALIRNYVDLEWGLSALPSIGVFAVITVAAPLVALLGSAALFQIEAPLDPTNPNGFADPSTAWAAWLIAVLAHTLAYMTVVPVGLASHAALTEAFTQSRRVVRWTRAVEAVLLAAAVTLVSATVFEPVPGHPIAQVILLFTPVPLVLYAALRFGLAGAALALFITACGAMRGAMNEATVIRATPVGIGVVVQQLLFLAISTPLLFLAAAIDERRRAAGELAARDARYAIATETGRVFVYSYEPASGAVQIDLSLGELLRLAPIELQSPTWWWRQVHPDDAGTLQRAWSARAESPFGTSAAGATDFRLLDRDGTVRWFRDRPAPFHLASADSAATVVGTVADITELRDAEQIAAQRSRELAHVARTTVVGELAAALAHEIRQPLTAILINSQTAMRVLDAKTSDPDAVREILQQLAADGRRASEVVQRVRAFAKKGDVERGPIDLNAMLREAVQLVRHDTIRRRVEIRFALTHESLVVIGDRVQLQQVALNLVLNALEALADRPLGAERLVLIETARAATHTAIVTIRDTGPGIARERQAAIFEPFITSKPNGLGVGLSISRTIVEAHGGVIWCESDPAVGGAAFMVAFPLGNGRPA